MLRWYRRHCQVFYDFLFSSRSFLIFFLLFTVASTYFLMIHVSCSFDFDLGDISLFFFLPFLCLCFWVFFFLDDFSNRYFSPRRNRYIERWKKGLLIRTMMFVDSLSPLVLICWFDDLVFRISFLLALSIHIIWILYAFGWQSQGVRLGDAKNPTSIVSPSKPGTSGSSESPAKKGCCWIIWWLYSICRLGDFIAVFFFLSFFVACV